jgi:hypothetical protein
MQGCCFFMAVQSAGVLLQRCQAHSHLLWQRQALVIQVLYTRRYIHVSRSKCVLLWPLCWFSPTPATAATVNQLLPRCYATPDTSG